MFKFDLYFQDISEDLMYSDRDNNSNVNLDSGFDLYEESDITVKSSEWVQLDYSIKLVLFNNKSSSLQQIQVIPRSSIYKTPLRLVSYCIDNYKVKVVVENKSNEPYEIKKGIRLFQVINRDLEVMKFINISSLIEYNNDVGSNSDIFRDLVSDLRNRTRYTLMIKPSDGYEQVYEYLYGSLGIVDEPPIYFIDDIEVDTLGLMVNLYAVFVLYDNYKKEPVPYSIRSTENTLDPAQLIKGVTISNYPPLIDRNYRGTLRILLDAKRNNSYKLSGFRFDRYDDSENIDDTDDQVSDKTAKYLDKFPPDNINYLTLTNNKYKRMNIVVVSEFPEDVENSNRGGGLGSTGK